MIDMAILNLTQHNATPEQTKAGVVDLPSDVSPIVRNLLTFDKIPSLATLINRADAIAAIAAECVAAEDRENDKGFALYAMIGGAPFFMSCLEKALKHRGLTPIYSFSQRESIETTIDGKVVKTSTFIHKGFVNV